MQSPADKNNLEHLPKTDQIHTGLGLRFALISLLLLLLVGFATFEVVGKSQDKLIEFQARELAEVVARLAASARSVYAKQVVGKLKGDGKGSHIDYKGLDGFVPLPAQFLKYVGKQAAADSTGLYRYRPLSKWNLEKSQGLEDEFQRWAWTKLEAQEKLAEQTKDYTWETVWRIEDMGGKKTLRFLRADLAVGESCVSCHNQYEMRNDVVARRIAAGLEPGKQWQLNQLLGAIEVDIPLNKVKALAADQTNFTFSLIVSIVVFGLVIIGLLVFVDATRVRRMAKKLRWHATHDPLTGLFNRSVFEERMQQLLNKSEKDNSEHVLLFLDLDQFKIVNDTCGHMAGDELLRQLSSLLKSGLKRADSLARLGGDEFGILLETTSESIGKEIAERIRVSIRDYRFDWDKKSFDVGVSIGMVLINREMGNINLLMSAADVACYSAKDEGRNRVHVYSPTDAEIQERQNEMEWASLFTIALEENRIQLAVQNVVAIESGVSPQNYQEVLLRMIDADDSFVDTETLIKAAERYNFMSKVDHWVLSTMFEYLKNGTLTADKDNILAVNLSGMSLSDDIIINFLEKQVLQNPRLPFDCICIEITETSAIRNLTKATYFIRRLKKHGFRFALDDFGSGLSSFSYLKNLDIDYIKIYGQFVQDIDTDPYDRAMVEATVKIAKVMKIPTIAEWVETEPVMQILKDLDVEYAQGFLINRPHLIDNKATRKRSQKSQKRD